MTQSAAGQGRAPEAESLPAALAAGLRLPVCRTCGVQYGAARADCPICADERQYVGWDGQQWTTLAQLRDEGHRGVLRDEGPGVVGVGLEPDVGIGQRALLVKSAGGNVLWDCVGYLDDELIAQVEEAGGLSAIAVSHPHFYGAMTEWARAFDVPVYVHAADAGWIARPDPHIELWTGAVRRIAPDLTLVNAGIHFPGGTVMHWAEAPGGGAALFSGDVFMVAQDRRWVSFMYSLPNFIPERPSAVRRALKLLEPFAFDRVYGAFWNLTLAHDGAAALRRSAERYLDFALDDSAGQDEAAGSQG